MPGDAQNVGLAPFTKATRLGDLADFGATGDDVQTVPNARPNLPTPRPAPTVALGSSWGPGGRGPESLDSGGPVMTTILSAVVVYDPERADPEKLALAGVLGASVTHPRRL